MKVIFLHGNGGGSVKDNWFPWLKSELEKLNVEVVAKDFPDPQTAKESNWLPFLKDELRADEESVLVGHSSGAVASMRFAENNKILGSVLVGACYTDLGDENEKLSGYYNRPWEWEKIKQNQNWIIQFASTDDPYIPIEEARHIHEMLGTEYYEMDNQRHFGDEVEKPEFPELLEVVKRKIKYG